MLGCNLSGEGQDFDGVNDSVNTGNVTGIANAITVSAWVKHDTLPNSIERYVTVVSETAVIRHNFDQEIQFYIKTDGSLRNLRVDGALTAGAWHYIVGTWDGTTQRLYLNGVQIASGAPGGTLGSATTVNCGIGVSGGQYASSVNRTVIPGPGHRISFEWCIVSELTEITFVPDLIDDTSAISGIVYA